MTNPNRNGYVLWEGPSTIDGAPLVVIATGFANASTNTKTGGMLQVYILRADVDPLYAINTGADASICGACPHRGVVVDRPASKYDGQKVTKRGCYVQVHNAPLSIWRCWRHGRGYGAIRRPADIRALFADRVVRLGAYGDPGAAPAWLWEAITARCARSTGYTHQWRTREDLRAMCMASVDSPAEASEAVASGWRYFRVADGPEALEGEALCPASEEAGRKTTCEDCGLCQGTFTTAAVSIVIPAHGNGATHFKALPMAPV